MFDYIKGTVTYIKNNAIVIETGGVGYLVYVANPYSFEIGKELRVYVYQQVKEDEQLLFGFKTIEEKELFLKLISVKGLGPKMTLPMFAVGSLDGIMDAIERENILYLKKFPKIGDKVAKQIILDLKGKLSSIECTDVNNSSEDLAAALEALGYKGSDIKSVIARVDPSLPIENQIKEALKLLLK